MKKKTDVIDPGIPTRSFLVIDPSIRSLGWAWFDSTRVHFRTGARSIGSHPSLVGLVRPSNADAWVDAGHQIEQALKQVIEPFIKPGSRVYCEEPAHFNSTVSGSGSLVKLAWGFGLVASVTFHYDAEFIPVSVAKWKGQLPKTIVKQRIRQILGEQNCGEFKHDIWDAVGIGLYILGKF